MVGARRPTVEPGAQAPRPGRRGAAPRRRRLAARAWCPGPPRPARGRHGAPGRGGPDRPAAEPVALTGGVTSEDIRRLADRCARLRAHTEVDPRSLADDHRAVDGDALADPGRGAGPPGRRRRSGLGRRLDPEGRVELLHEDDGPGHALAARDERDERHPARDVAAAAVRAASTSCRASPRAPPRTSQERRPERGRAGGRSRAPAGAGRPPPRARRPQRSCAVAAVQTPDHLPAVDDDDGDAVEGADDRLQVGGGRGRARSDRSRSSSLIDCSSLVDGSSSFIVSSSSLVDCSSSLVVSSSSMVDCSSSLVVSSSSTVLCSSSSPPLRRPARARCAGLLELLLHQPVLRVTSMKSTAARLAWPRCRGPPAGTRWMSRYRPPAARALDVGQASTGTAVDLARSITIAARPAGRTLQVLERPAGGAARPNSVGLPVGTRTGRRGRPGSGRPGWRRMPRCAARRRRPPRSAVPASARHPVAQVSPAQPCGRPGVSGPRARTAPVAEQHLRLAEERKHAVGQPEVKRAGSAAASRR